MGPKEYLYDLFVHDLTGPLSVAAATAKGLLSGMETYGPLTEQQKRCLKRIERNTKRAQLILKEILDVGRSEEHLFHTNEFSLQELVKDALLNVMETMDAELCRATARPPKPGSGVGRLPGTGCFYPDHG